ncbi:hypothetical protein HMPREF1982_00743 [Clostridiales bacterium oral taxon 876 str. F0540]|nr:hypothetical protein HMPREF1982_00743 [Clostridiales bacterium oral taxon 876 str. F0540]
MYGLVKVMKGKINKRFIIRMYFGLNIVIYVSFLDMDLIYKNLSNIYTVGLKYFIIILCFILTLLIGKDGYGKIDTVLVNCAKLLTLIADYYLLIANQYKSGILAFCLVQIVYILRHTLMNKKEYRNLIFLIVSLSISLILSLNICVKGIENDLLGISFVYAALLITSLYCGINTIKGGLYPRYSAMLIGIGIFLFFMCDLNVVLFNILQNQDLKILTGFLIWFFYAPSQLLLSLSGYNKNYMKQVFSYKG